MPSYYVASDIGGTFTDTVVIDSAGAVGRYKSSTVPDNPAQGVLDTLVLAADERGVPLERLLADVEVFAHGTTVATNAMLEGRSRRVGLIQTRGFGDTLTIMRGFKATGLEEDDIKRFRTLVKQPAAVPRRLIVEVTERIDYAGRVVCPLDEDDVRGAVRRLQEAGAEVFAVSLLWSFANDVHEKRVAEIIAEEAPGASVTLSSEFLPRIGEYERTLTTAVNASLRPVLKTSLDSFENTLAKAGLKTGPLLMQSNGGLATFAEVEKRAAATVMLARSAGSSPRSSPARATGTATSSPPTWAARVSTSAWSSTGGRSCRTRRSSAATNSPSRPWRCARSARARARSPPSATASCRSARSRQARAPARRVTAGAAPGPRWPTPTSCWAT